MSANNKCPVCSKTVYAAEKLDALGLSWHAGCFVCGGSNSGEGCKRKMNLQEYHGISGTPFCNLCFNRKANNIVTKPSGDNIHFTAEEKIEVNISDRASVFNSTTISSNTCPSCNKPVYPAEQLVALNKIWHKICFNCGATGSTDDGCNRRMTLTSYHGVSGVPFCDVCFNRKANNVVVKPNGCDQIQQVEEVVHVNLEDRASAFKSSTQFSTNCAVCLKNVFPAEQILAMNKIYHRNCFNCGNCNRKIDLSNYEVTQGKPYCRVCFDRLAKLTVAGVTPGTINDGVSSAPINELEMMHKINISEAKAKFNGGACVSSNNCSACNKQVFKAEEITALNSIWHLSCFTCGVNGGNGCNRKIAGDRYHGINGRPYCNFCFERLSKVAAATSAVTSKLLPKVSTQQANKVDDTFQPFIHVPTDSMQEQVSAETVQLSTENEGEQVGNSLV